MRRVLLAISLLAISSIFGCDAATETSPPRTESTRTSAGFRTRALLVQHFEKHGREFGAIGVAEYLRRAQALRDRRTGGQVLEAVREDGVITRFDRASGAFIAFERDGTIRTFFRPRQGETYYRRQLSRRPGAR